MTSSCSHFLLKLLLLHTNTLYNEIVQHTYQSQWCCCMLTINRHKRASIIAALLFIAASFPLENTNAIIFFIWTSLTDRQIAGLPANISLRRIPMWGPRHPCETFKNRSRCWRRLKQTIKVNKLEVHCEQEVVFGQIMAQTLTFKPTKSIITTSFLSLPPPLPHPTFPRCTHSSCVYSDSVYSWSLGEKKLIKIIYINWQASEASEASETLYSGVELRIGDICLYICGYVRMSFCTLTVTYFCVSTVFDPVPNFIKQNPPI